jgi:hypothetical protein
LGDTSHPAARVRWVFQLFHYLYYEFEDTNPH